MQHLKVTGLPPRQSRVVALAALGYSEKMTAREMGCSVANVKNLRASVFFKWRVPNITAAVATGFKLGHIRYIAAILLVLMGSFGDEPINRVGTRTQSSIVRVNRRQACVQEKKT